jgi:hypothetical protein
MVHEDVSRWLHALPGHNGEPGRHERMLYRLIEDGVVQNADRVDLDPAPGADVVDLHDSVKATYRSKQADCVCTLTKRWKKRWRTN